MQPPPPDGVGAGVEFGVGAGLTDVQTLFFPDQAHKPPVSLLQTLPLSIAPQFNGGLTVGALVGEIIRDGEEVAA